VGEFRERAVGDLTVRIDRGTCIASANCIKLAPELFELDE
jgi:ferredoxin